MTAAVRTIDSPIDPLTIVAEDGHLVGVHLQDHDRIGAVPVREPRPTERGDRADRQVLDAVVDQLLAYFDGELTTFDVPLHLAGTAFQRDVWHALLTIPYGHTASYGDIADAVGRPSAFRAVGLANGRNPVSIVVPCHRVIGSDGSLTGYGGGLNRKQWLLTHERRAADG